MPVDKLVLRRFSHIFTLNFVTQQAFTEVCVCVYALKKREKKTVQDQCLHMKAPSLNRCQRRAGLASVWNNKNRVSKSAGKYFCAPTL